MFYGGVITLIMTNQTASFASQSLHNCNLARVRTVGKKSFPEQTDVALGEV